MHIYILLGTLSFSGVHSSSFVSFAVYIFFIFVCALILSVNLWHELLKCTKWQFFTFPLTYIQTDAFQPKRSHNEREQNVTNIISFSSSFVLFFLFSLLFLKNHFVNNRQNIYTIFPLCFYLFYLRTENKSSRWNEIYCYYYYLYILHYE